MRLCNAFLSAALTMAAVSSVAYDQTSDREKARLIMLDRCVEQSSNRNNLFEDFAAACRCASKKTASKLTDAQIASVISAGKVTGSAASVWNEQMAACK
ncbi:MAG: hypothetical protein H6884_03040 [Rhodobiaceae bacterium]|nr:hypothetical protein [Rhodobiaceae bacterium]MCC0053012.1 hypothetical protein [Rhodobiaceae bacterium]